MAARSTANELSHRFSALPRPERLGYGRFAAWQRAWRVRPIRHQWAKNLAINIFVEPANLTVHISALRRMLRDGRDGNRFIINIPGRGYSFVASVEASASRRLEPPTFEGALSLDALQTPIRFDGVRVSNRTRRHAAVIRPTVRSNPTAAPQDRSLSGGKARNRPFARS